MKYLDRTQVPAPACLAKYRAGANDWSDLARNAADYEELCRRLVELQGERCAYCEADLARESQPPHVEHFEKRSRAPAMTFAWDNLFRSCTHPEHCGSHKDSLRGTAEPSQLLKPDVDNPREYLRFSLYGEVSPRARDASRATARAEETIRVFALNCRRLQQLRRTHLQPIERELAEAVRAEWTDGELDSHLALVAEDYRAGPFSSAVLDVLGIGRA